MGPKLVLAISTLALGTVLAAVPAIAQRAMNDGGFAPQDQSNTGPQGQSQPQGAQSQPMDRPQAQGGDNRQYYNYAGPNFGGPTLSGGNPACAQRFRSYDPATGTYMGFDGIRHPCP